MTVFALVLGLVIFAWFVYLWTVYPLAQMFVACCLTIVVSLFGSFRGVSAGFILIYPQDIVWGSALIAVALRLLTRRERGARGPVPLMGLLLLLVGLMAGLGSLTYGVSEAGNEARVYVYFLSAALALGLLPKKHRAHQAVRIFIYLGLGLSIVAGIGWIMHGLGGSTSEIRVVSPNSVFAGAIRDGRPITAASALVIAQSWVFCLLVGRELGLNTLVRTLGIFGMPLVVVLLQHRTVWFALALGLVLVFAAASPIESLTKARHGLVLTLPWLIVVLGALAALQLDAIHLLQESASSAFAPGGTFEWRVQSWLALINQDSSPLNWIFGHPFGAGYARTLAVGNLNGETDVNPHNFYVQTILRLGLVGLVLLVATLTVIVGRIKRSNLDVVGAGAGAGAIACGMLGVFFVTYPPTDAHGVLVGLAVHHLWKAK